MVTLASGPSLHLTTRLDGMATHGTGGEFNSGVEDWVSYSERLEQYFAANGIGTEVADQATHRAILLSCCGPPTYHLIRNLVAPEKPTDKTFEQLVELMRDHQQPAPSFIVQRYYFHTRVQKEGQTYRQFCCPVEETVGILSF